MKRLAAKSLRVSLALGAWAAATLVASCAASDAELGSERPGGPKLDCTTLGRSFDCQGDVAVPCAAPDAKLDCAAVGKTCNPDLGCVSCKPGTGTCENGHATACRVDGQGSFDFECDATQGMSCTPGGCVGACSPQELGASYVGCDYYPTVTANTGLWWSGFDFAVAVANTTTEPTQVVVTRGSETVESRTVAPKGLEIIKLAWVEELRGPEPDIAGLPKAVPPPSIVHGGAYRLRSDHPVTVYQFNPLDYEIAPAPAGCPTSGSKEGCFSYSNDASLLLPTHVLTRDYMAVTWNSLGCRSGFVTVTATRDDTTVQLSPVGEWEPGAGIDENGHGIAKLNAGDVIQISAADAGGPFCMNYQGTDISGTRVSASKPVQVIAGHACANLPTPKTDACDHLEEAMFPLETLGKDYLVAVPADPSGDKSPHTIRILATEPGTELTLDPPLAPAGELAPGKPLEIPYVLDDVRVTATKPVLVAAFMQGSKSVPSGAGDPSESLAVATEQFRADYVFLAPKNYDVSFVNVVAKLGANISVDGALIPAQAFSPIGNSGYGVARWKLEPTEIHEAKASEKFGITVYGYGTYTSFMYPGGLDLAPLVPPLPH